MYGQTQVCKLAKGLHMDANLISLEFGLWKAGRPKANNLYVPPSTGLSADKHCRM